MKRAYEIAVVSTADGGDAIVSALISIIKECLRCDPSSRITIEDLLLALTELKSRRIVRFQTLESRAVPEGHVVSTPASPVLSVGLLSAAPHAA